MSRLINCSIVVHTQNDIPKSFLFNQKQYPISSIQEHWHEIGQWWQGETPRYIYRVLANDSLFELHFHQQHNEWILYRLFD